MALHVSGMRDTRMVGNRFPRIVLEQGGAGPKPPGGAVIARYGSVTGDTPVSFRHDSALASDRCMNRF